jgi:AcrR family transcriptional regulator
VAGGDYSQRWAKAGPEDAADRERLVAAVAKAASEHGYSGLTVDHVLRNAGVPKATFDRYFESKEQCLLAAQDAFFDRLWLDVVSACDSSAQWPLKVRAALGAILASLVEGSNLARVFAVEAAAASFGAAERQFAALDQFATLLRDGRRHYPDAASLPDVTERALVGGIASIVAGHLLMEDPLAIPALETQLVELVLTPYLGEGEARRVAGV